MPRVIQFCRHAHALRGMCLGEWKQTFLCVQVHMCQKNTSAMPLPYTGTRPSEAYAGLITQAHGSTCLDS